VSPNAESNLAVIGSSCSGIGSWCLLRCIQFVYAKTSLKGGHDEEEKFHTGPAAATKKHSQKVSDH
jgi:ABC-type histidine transport system ATPase subunit